MPRVYLVILLLALTGLALTTGYGPFYLLLYALASLTVVGYLWAWLQGHGVEAQVETLSPHPQAGQPLLLRITLRERLGIPRVGLRVRLTGPLAIAGEEMVNLQPRSSYTWTQSVLGHRRGLNHVGFVTISSTDPFGLVRLQRRLGDVQDIMVYPSVIPLSPALSLGYASVGDRGDIGYLGVSISASRVRQYVSGDSMARIHWPTTARLRQLMTKEFDSGGFSETWLFVDMQSAVQAGNDLDSTEEYIVTIAASLARYLIERGQSVGLVAQGESLHQHAPDREPAHLWALMRSLAIVRAKGRTPLGALVAREGKSLGPESMVVLIAPWPGENLSALLQFLARRGIGVAPILLDASSFGQRQDTDWLVQARGEMRDRAWLVRRGDDLATSLHSVMDRLGT